MRRKKGIWDYGTDDIISMRDLTVGLTTVQGDRLPVVQPQEHGQEFFNPGEKEARKVILASASQCASGEMTAASDRELR